MPFLSPNTLHILDRVMWMLPFATVSDLNQACERVDVSHDTRNAFLQKMQAEHSAQGSSEQLKNLWLAWLKQHYADTGPREALPRTGAEVETPEGSEDEGAAGGGGGGDGV